LFIQQCTSLHSDLALESLLLLNLIIISQFKAKSRRSSGVKLNVIHYTPKLGEDTDLLRQPKLRSKRLHNYCSAIITNKNTVQLTPLTHPEEDLPKSSKHVARTDI
jgi:hypothetical protein